MTKIMTMPTKENLKEVVLYSDAILLGIEGMCTNVPDSYTLEEIKEVTATYPNVEVFVALNKNMHKEDLDTLKNLLLEVENLSIHGIFYYDIAVFEYHKDLDLHTPLVWSQEHLTTNYATMNYWYNEGVDYTYVSAEITLEEILAIKTKTDSKMIVPIFGYLPMFVSKRHLIENYKEYFSLDKTCSKYSLHKEGNSYPIDTNASLTVVYSAHILNGLLELEKLEESGISYVTLNSYRIKPDVFVEILRLYKNRKYGMDEKVEELLPNVDKGFLYKETVYRVKKNEKK